MVTVIRRKRILAVEPVPPFVEVSGTLVMLALQELPETGSDLTALVRQLRMTLWINAASAVTGQGGIPLVANVIAPLLEKGLVSRKYDGQTYVYRLTPAGAVELNKQLEI
jgi:hypothetical protein